MNYFNICLENGCDSITDVKDNKNEAETGAAGESIDGTIEKTDNDAKEDGEMFIIQEMGFNIEIHAPGVEPFQLQVLQWIFFEECISHLLAVPERKTPCYCDGRDIRSSSNHIVI